jgi:hypothetical protein
MDMTRAYKLGLSFVLFSGLVSILWGWSMAWSAYKGPLDFQAVYYGSRALTENHNPYKETELERFYLAASGDKQPVNEKQFKLITLFVNTPGVLLLVAPLALLPLQTAQVIWMILTAGSLVLASALIYGIAAEYAPIVSACLAGFLLLNCQVVIAAGNTAAMVVGFCVIATWCFVRGRFVVAGVMMMAISLAIKPHDSGLVFLFFLLTGSRYRKHALQSAAVAVFIYATAVLWLSNVAPTWLHDWQANLASIAAPGGMNDPRPGSVASTVGAATVISLQSVFSIFHDSLSFANIASYVVCGSIMLPWAIGTIRSRSPQTRGWFALAAIAPLTMLITYHRVYDAKLLLLCIPGCVALWAKRGRLGWAALVLTFIGLVLTADVPLVAYGIMLQKLHISVTTLSGQLLTVLLARPSQEVLLSMSLFYLLAYLRKVPSAVSDETGHSDQEFGHSYASGHAGS